MQRMDGAERFTFVAGIIEGLAMARYARDNQQPAGMRCIYDFLYQNREAALRQIYAGFERYPTYPPGTVVHVLVSQRCPG